MGCAGCFDGEDAEGVLEEPAQLAAGAPAHRVVVLLHGRGGKGTRACWVRQAAVLFRERCGRVLGDHEPRVDTGSWAEEGGQALRASRIEHAVYSALGDRTYLGGGDGEEVEHERERLTMEVSSALDPAIRKHDGVVGDGGELAGRDPPGMPQRVARRAVDQRGA